MAVLELEVMKYMKKIFVFTLPIPSVFNLEKTVKKEFFVCSLD